MNNDITLQEKNTFKIDNLAYESYNLSLEILKNTLESIDDNIFSRPERMRRYYVKGFYNRTVTTCYGTVSFKRRLYIDKDTREYVFLLDKLIELKSYSRLTNQAILAIVSTSLGAKSYKYAGKVALSGTIVSRQTVFNCLKRATFKAKEAKESQKIEADCIHISIDGFFANYRDFKKKIETKFCNIFAGRECVGKKRNKLLNKKVISQSNKTNFKANLIKALNSNYKIDENTKIYVCGDGATWIKELVSNISNSQFVIDKFHFVRELRNMPDKEKAITDFKNGNLSGLISQSILCKTDSQIRAFKYVVNNYEYTEAWKNEDFECCVAENVVSHVFNHRLRSIPRNWGINYYKMNYGLALDSTNDLVIEIDKTGNDSIEKYEHIGDVLKTYGVEKYETNIPAFLYKRTGISTILRAIIK